MNLNNLWLNGNPCPNGVARNNRNVVFKLIATAKSTCQSAAFLRLQKKFKVDCSTLPPPTLPPITTTCAPQIVYTEKPCPTDKPIPICPICTNISESSTTCPYPIIHTTSITTEKPCPTQKPATKCPKCSTKCENIGDIFDGYDQIIADIQAQCESSGNQLYKSKIEDFEAEFGNMHSEFSHKLYLKSENLKSNISQICE
ncbi:hypothetical protein ACKWTF_012937 [Chironomus riparius]